MGGLSLFFIMLYFILTHHRFEINRENPLNVLSQGHDESTLCACAQLRVTSTKLSYVWILNMNYNLGCGVEGVFEGAKLQLRFGILSYWGYGSNTDTIDHGCTHARTHQFLRSHGASKRAVAPTAGARRARTGGGIRVCGWGWTGTGERTDGSSAGR